MTTGGPADLNRIRRGSDGGSGSKIFGHHGFFKRFGEIFICGPAGVVAEEAASLHVGAHCGDQGADRSEISQGFIAYLSRSRPGDTLFKASSEKPQSVARGAD